METNTKTNKLEGTNPLRRSSRQAKPSVTAEVKAVIRPTNAKIMEEPRRNPKRKASETPKHTTNLPDNLLEEALAPLSAKDIEDWEGWIELESEPAFFNIILKDLGVKNVKAQEIFTIDQESLDFLPKPVFGLIFLFQYQPDHDEVDQDEDTSGVWFANQTTENACATVALLNIIMNSPEIDLGDKLREFKESTKDLCTQLRGYQLGNNSFIRTIHNSFTRRMDHLNADLCLENEVSDSGSKKAKKRATPKKGRKTSTKKKVSNDYGFHFIAYVPASGHVWELDGLRDKPHRLDAINSSDWTDVARPQIEARMLQYEESQLSFNLLALCQSPLVAHARNIAISMASLRHFRDTIQQDEAIRDIASANPMPLNIEDDTELALYGLNKSAIDSAPIPESLRAKITHVDSNVGAVHELHEQLIIEIKASMGEYRAEIMAIAEDEQRVNGRKKDYGPALHKWISKLAEKGVLEEMIKEQ